MEISKALAVEVDESYSELDTQEAEFQALQNVDPLPSAINQPTQEPATAQRVQCHSSPYFFAFYKHKPCKIVIDTGATSSIVSQAFVQRAGITLRLTSHAARQIDKTPLKVLGEVKFNISFRDFILPIEALVTDSLDCDILAGVPFCRNNDINAYMGSDEISIHGIRIPYGCKPSDQHEIYRVQTSSSIVRSSFPAVIYPGEYLEINDSDFSKYEGEIAIEPRIDSPLDGTWPKHAISRIVGGTLRIPNDTSEPVHVKKSQHLATVRKVTSPPSTPLLTAPTTPPMIPHKPSSLPFSSAVTLDPNNVLSKEEKNRFTNLNKTFDNVFNPKFGVYNDRSGRIRAKLNLGPVIPPPRKPKLPFYTQSQLQLLKRKQINLKNLVSLQNQKT